MWKNILNMEYTIGIYFMAYDKIPIWANDKDRPVHEASANAGSRERVYRTQLYPP